MGRHYCRGCGTECCGTVGCDDPCPSYGDGDCWCDACWDKREDTCVECGGGCCMCNYGTFQGPKTPDACKYECCGSLGERGFEEPFCVRCVLKIKHFNHPQHETTLCDACEEPTCQYREPLCCSKSPFATPETLAELTAYKKKRKRERKEEEKEEDEELALEQEQERQHKKKTRNSGKTTKEMLEEDKKDLDDLKKMIWIPAACVAVLTVGIMWILKNQTN